MRPSVRFRLLAFVVALLGGLSAPAMALTHGLVHAHLVEHSSADEHRREHPNESSTATWSPMGPVFAFESHSDADHAHGHASLDAVPGSRLNGRLDLPTPDVAMPSMPDTIVTVVVAAHAPALADHALLARPDPGGGAPPRLRAPPAS